MKYYFVSLVVAFLSILHMEAADLFGNSPAKFKKVLDVQTGILDDEFCNRDCPRYPGGEEALFKYIYSQLGISGESGNQNATIVKFLVTSSGKVKDITIEKTANEEYDRDIIKIISSLPNFLPAKDGNSCYYGWINISFPK